MVLYASQRACLSLNKECNSLEIIWEGECSSEEYREVLGEILKALKEFRTPNLLSDATKTGVISPVDRLWMEFNVLPQAATYGLHNFAFIVPDDIFVRKHADKVKEAVQRLGLNLQHFSELQTSREWLLSFPTHQKLPPKE